ncbi:hypothetical protein ACKGJO_09225 [Gracilimonas sp. Q87]|uniref:hypothetical protein n=1 Tax=Gracilimonas sp. Q87 TaxID=3384766 RepID=UPI0039843964
MMENLQPFKIYFAGSWSLSKHWLEEQGGNPVRNRLVSFAYPEQFGQWLHQTDDAPGNVILDSGAFSAWNKGREIDINEYIEYAHQCIAQGEKANKKVHVVNLDVIPGEAGEMKGINLIRPKTRRKIDEAAKQGFDNMVRMKKEGITPIHVFHQHEHFRWLDKMLEQTDYIGISPANDLSTKARRLWMDKVFTYLNKTGANVKTHGFGVTSIPDLKQFPWHSCDSASWVLLAAYGQVMWPVKGFKRGSVLSNSDYNVITVSEKSTKRGVGGISEGVIKCFERQGYSYQDLQAENYRKLINIRTFLKMQKDLNVCKTASFKKQHFF